MSAAPSRTNCTLSAKPGASDTAHVGNTAFGLMNLPPEIRRLILKELLGRREPLVFRTRLRVDMRCLAPAQPVHREVLAVCRQLHREGEDVFFSNKIHCRIDAVNGDGTFPLPRAIADRHQTRLKEVIKRLGSVDIRFCTGRSQNLAILRHGARMYAQVLQHAARVDKLKIELVLSDGREPAEYYDSVLKPFCYVRNMKHVEISGATAEFGDNLAKLMMSKADSTDLNRMLTSLQRYMQRSTNVKDLLYEPSKSALTRIWDRFEEVGWQSALRQDRRVFGDGQRELMRLVRAYWLEKKWEITNEYSPDTSRCRALATIE